MIDVCICTHNPRQDLLALVLNSLAAQTASADLFRVVVIDNASTPPLQTEMLAPLQRRGVVARIVFEPRLGLTQARVRAAAETDADWVCFVDDDNVLCEGYLEAAIAFARAHPNVGAFGGKLLLPASIEAPGWTRPFLPFLGVKDLGENVRTALSPHWCECEPAGAGAVVHRSVLQAFCTLVADCPDALALGRKGTGLASCDDSLLMRGSYNLRREVAYEPSMVLYHHINPSRLSFGYLAKLMFAYGESQVVLERVLGGDAAAEARHYRSPLTALRTLLHAFLRDARKSPAFGLAMLGYHYSAWRAHGRMRAAA